MQTSEEGTETMSGKKRQKNINNRTVAKDTAVKEKEAAVEEKDGSSTVAPSF